MTTGGWIYCGEHVWMCDEGAHFREAEAAAGLENEQCQDCARKGEKEGPVSVREPVPVTTGGSLYCSGKCAAAAKDLTNETKRTPLAEGTCAHCGTWINDPFARCYEEAE